MDIYMNRTISISVIGAGSWGTTIAKHLAEKKHTITLWTREEAVKDSIKKKQENSLFLPGIKLPKHITPTTHLIEALKGKSFIVFSVPSQYARQVINEGKEYIHPKALLINTAKGIEAEHTKLMHEVFQEILANTPTRYVTLSGPSFAREVALEKPTAVAAASKNISAAKTVQRVFADKNFGVEVTNDVVGVEIAGSLKNVVAIAVGISDGLALGHNARAAIMTKGLAEIASIGMHMRANPMTFMGPAGIGDLALTCTGELSRNREVGIRLANGEHTKDIISSMHTVAEGIYTSLAAKKMAAKFGASMPIATEMHRVLHEGKSPKKAIFELITH